MIRENVDLDSHPSMTLKCGLYSPLVVLIYVTYSIAIDILFDFVTGEGNHSE
jgi:hypothetical protein